MPADIVTMADCASNYGVFHVPSSGSGRSRVRAATVPLFYVVTFNGSEGPASCTCPAYQFSSGQHCKHIALVYKGACMYNPQWHDGNRDPDFRPKSYTYDAFVTERCPACGGPMVAVRRAV